MSSSVLDNASGTLSPLPPVLSQGLVAVSFFGFISFFFATSLFIYLTFRLIAWRRKTRSQAPTNQFLFLIYNLLLADIQQALAFLLNVHTIQKKALEVGTSVCFAQGWFVSTGDLASSVFILAIAVHTFLAVVKSYKLSSLAFYSAIAGLWSFVYLMAIIGPSMHPNDLYVRAGAWCWINDEYQSERLWLHYFWIFVAMFSTITIYATIAVTLRYRKTTLAATPHGATPLMIVYPLIYTVCTAPLAGGRIASMAGQDVPLAYFCVAGSMIACNGWLDVLLYSLTRRSIIFCEEQPGDAIGIETFTFLGKGHRMGNTTTIEAGLHAGLEASHGRHSSSRIRGRRFDSTASTENLYAAGGGLGPEFGRIKAETTIDVKIVKHDSYEMQSRFKTGSNGDMASLDTKSGRSYEEI